MLKIFNTLFAAGCFLFLQQIYGQQFGGNNSSIHWQKINTPQARIIFPKGDDSIAQRIANIFASLNATTLNSIGTKTKKINLVLQDQTTISNAYVGLGPFRSEFFLNPVQNSFEQGGINWADQLAVHEYRHVQQYNNFNVGVSKVLHTLFGEEGQALGNDGAIPNWFFEGDAVYNETNVTYQGRGRLPYFFKDYRSLWNTGTNYSYMKLRNGSYKNFVPDHYALGYLLVSYGYEKYGSNFWLNVTRDAAAYKGLFYSFQSAIQRYGGVSFAQFRKDAFKFFESKVTVQKSFTTSKSKNERFFDEQYPNYDLDDHLIYVRSTYKKIPSFVIKKENKQNVIRSKDISIDNYFSYKNGKIVYAAFQPDIRWGYKDYSDLKIIDVNTGKETDITHHTKYFSPDINIAGNTIAAVKVSAQGNSEIHLIDVTSKSVKVFKNLNHYFYTYPKFISDNSIVAAVRNPNGKMALNLLNISNGEEKLLTPLSYNVVGFLTVSGDTIFFTTSYGTEDRLLAISIKNPQLFLIKNDTLHGDGMYHPTLGRNKIAWTEFTKNGFRIKEVNRSSLNFIPVSNSEYVNATSEFGLSKINSNKDLLSNISNVHFPVSTYHKGAHIFNFHSIEPEFNDPIYTLNIVGENILNSLQSQISLSYDRNEKYKKAAVSLVYAGLFPFLSTGVSYTVDRSALFQNKIIHWNDAQVYAGINLPFNLSKGRSLTYINVGSQYVYNQSVYQAGIRPHKISYSYLNTYGTFINQVQRARQQIYPRFAQTLRLQYKNTLTDFTGQQFVANGNLYLPGLLSSHSLIFNFGMLNQDTSRQVAFSSGFPFSRGYAAFNFHQMVKFGVNYSLPLFYPDAGFANLVYLLRIRTNLFYDDTEINDFRTNHTSFSKSYRSYGTEVFFDTKWFNQAPITIGFRYSHPLDRNIYGTYTGDIFDLILPVNIFHN